MAIPEDVFPPFPPVWVPVLAVIIYGVTLRAIQIFMKDRPPFVLKWPLLIHNVILCIMSILLFGGIVYEALMTFIYFGPLDLYCGTGSDEWDLRLLKWGIWFYLSKFYELFDTVFLALRKKELSLLHLFHHILVVTACWIQVNSEMYFGWITGILNAGIHIFMYYYFAMQCLGFSIWWKRYLTSAQIIQFYVDCFTSVPFAFFWAYGYRCRGDIRAWILANIGGVLLILLFMNFYRQTYTRSPSTTPKAGKKSQ